MMATSRLVVFAEPLLVIRTACLEAHIRLIDDKWEKIVHTRSCI